MSPAPDRSVYFTEERPVCFRGGCPYAFYLKHYRADGTLDSRFGAGGRPVTTRSWSSTPLIADGHSRPLIAWEKPPGERGVFIRRFRRDGSVDASFGDSGTVFVACGCYLDSLTTMPGGYLLLSGHSESKGRDGKVKTRWLFARLGHDGRPERSFGRGGEVWVSMRAYWVPDAVIPLRGGSTWLAGFRERDYDNTAPYVIRLSKEGNIDRRFAAVARRSLTGLYETDRDAVGWEGLSLIPRSRGRVDLYGHAYRKGVAVRLRRDGKRDRSFGRNGTLLLPFETTDVVADSSGGALAVGYRRGRYGVLRVGPDGRVDRGFGRVGLPGAYNEYGLAIFAAGGRGTYVLARGESFCRGSCPAEPKLYRLLGR